MIIKNKTIDAFFNELCATSYENFAQLIEKHEINHNLLINYASWSSEKHKRIRLNKNEDCELLLICWMDQQETAIHNHAGQKCWVHNINGTFKESIFQDCENLETFTTHSINPGETTFLSDKIGLHTLKNVSGNLAMTLHLYSKPINTCKTYNKETGESNYIELTNDIDLVVEEKKEMEMELLEFLKLSKNLLKDEVKNPISRRIPTNMLKEELDIELNESPIPDNQYYEILNKIVLATPKTSTKLFFNQLFGGRQPKAVLGDLLAVMLNNSMYTYKVGGVQVGIEKEIINKVIKRIGYGAHAGGTFPTGGSMSNFNAMLMARDWKDQESKTTGISKNLVAYTSIECHYSIEKNAAFIGLGRANVRKIKVDNLGKMDTLALRKAIEKDIQAGKTPFFVNATAGTTVLGAFDPFGEIASIAQEFKLWMHVDGAYCGATIFSDNYKFLLNGVEKSDSFSFNPHKMLGTPLTCSIIVVKNKEYLYSSFSNKASYLYQTDGDEYNPGKISFQCGRRNDALKLWTLWKSVGSQGLRKLVDHQYKLAEIARKYVEEHPDYTLYSFKNSVSVCFNYKDIPARKLCTRMYQENKLMVGYGKFRETQFIRLVTVNATNQEEDILNIFKVIEAHSTSHSPTGDTY